MALVIHMHWTLLQIQVLLYHAVPCQSMSRADCEYVYIYMHIWALKFLQQSTMKKPQGLSGLLRI